MTWAPRTERDRRRHDVPERIRLPSLPGEPVVEVEVSRHAHAPIRCRCGRLVTPAMMVDVRGLDVALIGPHDGRVCDACWNRLERTATVTLADLADAQDAPAEDVAELVRRHGRTTPPRERGVDGGAGR